MWRQLYLQESRWKGRSGALEVDSGCSTQVCGDSKWECFLYNASLRYVSTQNTLHSMSYSSFKDIFLSV